MMPRPLTTAVTRLARTPPMQRVSGAPLRVVAYHDVADGELFERHLELLAAEYTPISMSEVLGAYEGRTLPDRAVLVTFDDGDRSVLEVAAPLLAKREIPAVAFVVAGVLGTQQPFWWEVVEAVADDEEVRRLKRVPDRKRRAEVAGFSSQASVVRRQLTTVELIELESMGVAIGNHTLTHPILDQCEDTVIETEICGSKAILEEALGHAVDAFAYPNGDEDDRVVDAVRRSGHRVAFRFDHRLERTIQDGLRISRLRTNSTDPVGLLALKLSGIHTTLLRARGRV